MIVCTVSLTRAEARREEKRPINIHDGDIHNALHKEAQSAPLPDSICNAHSS